MTNDPLYHRLLEISWLRKLTEAETKELQAWLTAHPEAESEWLSEASLSELLAGLPEAPMPSNFTARVLAEARRQVELEVTKRGKLWQFWNGRSKWLPRVAFAAVVASSGLLAYHQHWESVKRRENLAQDLVTLANLGAMPSQVLTNFDAIQLMSAANTRPTADVQLLTLMQ